MATRKQKPLGRKAILEELRLLAAIVGTVTDRPMSRPHCQAIATYAAKNIPERVLNRLHTRSGSIAAMDFIGRTLEEPHVSP